jgi:hypothetical protein
MMTSFGESFVTDEWQYDLIITFVFWQVCQQGEVG